MASYGSVFNIFLNINRYLMSVTAFGVSGIKAWVTMVGDFAFSLVLYFSITLALV